MLGPLISIQLICVYKLIKLKIAHYRTFYNVPVHGFRSIDLLPALISVENL